MKSTVGQRVLDMLETVPANPLIPGRLHTSPHVKRANSACLLFFSPHPLSTTTATMLPPFDYFTYLRVKYVHI